MFSRFYAFGMKERRRSGQAHLEKKVCELCGYDNPSALHIHHIIPRCDIERTSEDNWNLCCCCATCHSLIHAPEGTGRYIIIGCFSTTAGRKIMWFKEGEEPPLEKKHWLIKENPLVIRGKKNEV